MASEGVYGFFCPHCRKEIKYDMGYYNRKIAELKGELYKINLDLASYKASGRVDEEWKLRAIKALEIKRKQLSQLRSFRAAANEVFKDEEMKIFWRLVKEEIGEVKWKELHKKAEAELEYSTAYNSMKETYAQADGKTIRKV